MTKNFYADQIFLDICKIASKYSIGNSRPILSGVAIFPDGTCYYTNSYFIIKYKLPSEIPDLQKGLFDSLEEKKESRIKEPVVIFADEFAKTITMKSSDTDTGKYAVIRTVGDKVEFDWVSAYSEKKSLISTIQGASIPDYEYIYKNNEDFSGKCMANIEYIKDLSALAHKYKKNRKCDDGAMVSIYQSKKIQILIEDLNIIIMGLNT